MSPHRTPYASRGLLVAALLLSSATLTARATAENPIVQTIYTADPAPLVHDGRVYLYTTHDEDTLVNDFFTMNEWRVYSSTDIVNWTDHGSPLRYSDFSWASGDAWAGQVIERDGRFYFYIPTTSRSLGRMVIGVAVSDSPTGPFEDALGAPLITENCGDIDPSVFIDGEDAYLYWGNPNLCYVKLNADMVSFEGPIVRVPMTTASFGTRSDAERPTSYEEGPWFYKRNDRYYLVFAAGPISEHIGYATSPSPTGPWTYGGVVMPTQGASFTNHPGVIDFMGSSYFFYHDGSLPGGGGFHRSVCVERFSYGADGSIPRIDMTKEGAPQIGAFDPYVQNEAETIAWASGVETESSGEAGMHVTAISNGDYIKVTGVDFGTGALSFDARVAAATAGANIELRLDSDTGMLAGTCAVPNTGGAETWMTVTCTVNGATGKHDLFFKFTGPNGASLFEFDSWRFTPRDAMGGAGGAGGMGGAAAGGSGGTGAMAGMAGAAAGGVATTGGLPNVGGTPASGGSPASGGGGATQAGSGGAPTAGSAGATGGLGASSGGSSPGGHTSTGAGGWTSSGGTAGSPSAPPLGGAAGGHPGGAVSPSAQDTGGCSVGAPASHQNRSLLTLLVVALTVAARRHRRTPQRAALPASRD